MLIFVLFNPLNEMNKAFNNSFKWPTSSAFVRKASPTEMVVASALVSKAAPTEMVVASALVRKAAPTEMVIAYLAKHNRLRYLRASLYYLFKNFLNRFPYKVLIFHSGDIT